MCCYVVFSFLPESMRWLTVKGKVEEAAKVVEQIARINKKEYDQDKCFKKIQVRKVFVL